MKPELTIIPHATVHPDRICTWNEISWNPSRPSKKNDSAIDYEIRELNKSFLESKRKHSGTFSKHAKRKISRSIDYMLATSIQKKVFDRLYSKYIVFKIAFVTLTLPATQIHTDKEITEKCFNQFLTEIRKYHNVTKYVWRAEKQKNGNIHYHLLTDCFIPWYELKNRWNRIINKLGYVDRYQEKNGNKQPNSTDIHSTRKIKNVKKYVTKYLTKSEFDIENSSPEEIEKQIVQCRLWSCSQNLSNIKGCDLIIDSEIQSEIEKVITNSNCHKYTDTYFSVFYIDFEKLRKFGATIIFEHFLKYLNDQFKFNYQHSIPI